MTLTIVTCMYDVRKKENNQCGDIKKDYLELGKGMMSVSLPMVVFTDEQYIAEHVHNVRMGYGLLDKTFIVQLPLEDTLFYNDLGLLTERMVQYPLTNINKDKDTPLYVILNNNKFDFLKRSIKQNPFNTDYFLWMDFGISHCCDATPHDWLQVSHEWAPFIQTQGNRIHQLRIHLPPKPNHMAWKDYMNTIYHHMAGGVFGGHRDILHEYIQLFCEKWKNMLYKEEWWQLDEAIMCMIAHEHPEKFRFFYGDYDGIISNFIRVKKQSYLVFQIAQRYIDQNQPQLAARVLMTMDRQYIKKEQDFEKYIVLLEECVKMISS